MNAKVRAWLPEAIGLVALALYPVLPFREDYGTTMTTILIFCVLALGLNVVVGYTGLLHLGIAAFFGIGAYITGILTASPTYPFYETFTLDLGFVELNLAFTAALVLSTAGAAAAGLMLGAPTLRLRGDYLAVVTLGFGEVVRYALRNLEEITNGTRGLGPIPLPDTPDSIATPADWAQNYRWFYFLALAILALVVLLLRFLEDSRLGRAWNAIREDELAATCMGINAARVKLSAFAVGAGIAGLAGCLYATNQRGTAQPDAYNFNLSIITLCCIILGGLASIRGTILGMFLLRGFDNVLAPMLDDLIQRANINPDGSDWLKFTSYRLMFFGLALILMMRFRPEGLWPSSRVKQEMHSDEAPK